MSGQFLRFLTMLQQVPTAPKKTTTRDLQTALEQHGVAVSQRTIQRDLKSLMAVLPGLQVDGARDFPGWSWSRDVKLMDLPHMDVNVALTFQLADYFLRQLFPPSVLAHLQPYFERAEAVLQVGSAGYDRWRQKVRFLSRTQPLIAARIDDEVVAAVYRSLFEGRQFRGRYVKRDGDEVEYDINPLGLIFRESVVYLVATVWHYRDVRHFALHRFRSCRVQDEPALVPEGFNLDEYIAQGSFFYVPCETAQIELQIRFYQGAGYHLLETPLSHDQQCRLLTEDEVEIQATVADSAQLRWWLLGFGAKVKVIAPSALRLEMREIAGEMVRLYDEREGELS